MFRFIIIVNLDPIIKIYRQTKYHTNYRNRLAQKSLALYIFVANGKIYFF